MTEAVVHRGPGQDPLEVRLRGSHPNFFLRTDTIEARALASLDPMCEDLLEIAAVVFCADSGISRGGEVRAHLGRDWRRMFEFAIPVRHPGFWNRDDVREALTDAVEFLTEDSVSFTFAAGDFPPMREPFLRFDPTGPVFDAQEVILFSGGLDSFAGALEVLSTTSDKVLLLSHRSAQKVIPRQEKLGEYLSDRFEGRVQHLQVNARRRGAEGKETTQRSRSLLFAALGRAVGQSLGIKRVSFYENGVVSQNLPISPQVVGTMATRTTHPLALLKLNKVFDLMGEGGIRIENRYAWLTKTDIVRRIEQHGGKEQIGTAVSCTSVRDQTKLHTHCGACSQCLDRRFAILAAGLEKHDPVESYAVDVLTGERQTRQSITMAMEWTRHGLRLRQLDERGLFDAFGLELTRILKGHPELSRSEALNRTLQLQHRHSEQLRGALERAVQEHAAELVGNSLPATSLLVLHVTGGSGVTPGISKDPRLHVPTHQETGPIPEVDLNPDPDAPLVISFFTEGAVPVIAARGLGRVQGSPAQVAHDLKPAFARAIQEGLRREQHPYIRPHEIFRDKDWVRQNVKRCRSQLAEQYAELHARHPARPLLIESVQPRGYRLDPGIEAVLPERIGSSKEK